MPKAKRFNSTIQRVAILVVVAFVAASVFVVLNGKSTKSASAVARTQLCTALSNIASYESKHPPKHTYADLKNTITYDHSQFAGQTTPPVAVRSNVVAATSASQAIIDVVDKIIAKVKFTKAQDAASFNEITKWKKARSALATWRTANCSSK